MNKEIKSFFKGYDKSIRKYPYQLATEFLSFCYDNPEIYECNSDTNILSVSNQASLHRSVTRSLILDPKIAVVQQAPQATMFVQRIYSNNEVCRRYIRCPALDELGQWLWDAKDLLINQKVIYIPNGYEDIERNPNSQFIVFGRNPTHIELNTVLDTLKSDRTGNGYIQSNAGQPLNPNTRRYSIPNKRSVDITSRQVFQVINSTNHAILSHNTSINPNLLGNLFSVDIPMLDSIPLPIFSAVIQEKAELFEKFSLFLQQELLQIDPNDRNKLDKLAVDIRLKSIDLKKAIEKNLHNFLLKSGSVALATISANLYLVNLDWLEITQAIIGGSSTGITAELAVLREYLDKRKDNRTNPLYFLWVLEDKMTNARSKSVYLI